MAKNLSIEISLGNFARLPLDPELYDELIETEGIEVTVRRAVPCPCVRIETLRSRVRCPHCNGLRWTYPRELELELVALVLNRSPKRVLQAPGEIVTGTVTCTFTREYIPGAGDLVLPQRERHVVTQTLIHKENQHRLAALRQQERARAVPQELLPKPDVPGDRLLYSNPLSIDYVAFIDGGRLVLGRDGVHWRLVDGCLEWTDLAGLQPGDAYSVRYTAPAAYMLNPGEPVARAGVDGFLPYRCQGMRLDRWSSVDLLDNRT
jgi:hypothetical protein